MPYVRAADWHEYQRWKLYHEREQWADFEMLLSSALEAGEAAAAATAPDPQRRGTVFLKLADGRSRFAVFMRVNHPDMYRRGTRRTGNYLTIGCRDFMQAQAYAQAVQAVLAAGNAQVVVQTRPLSETGT